LFKPTPNNFCAVFRSSGVTPRGFGALGVNVGKFFNRCRGFLSRRLRWMRIKMNCNLHPDS
jgi:hypothetical protein